MKRYLPLKAHTIVDTMLSQALTGLDTWEGRFNEKTRIKLSDDFEAGTLQLTPQEVEFMECIVCVELYVEPLRANLTKEHLDALNAVNFRKNSLHLYDVETFMKLFHKDTLLVRENASNPHAKSSLGTAVHSRDLSEAEQAMWESYIAGRTSSVRQ